MPADLTLPDVTLRVARSVAAHYATHDRNQRDQLAADLIERADRLRDNPSADDPLKHALQVRCNQSLGLVFAQPHVVAAVALEEFAKQLAGGTPHTPHDDEKEKTGGHD